LVPTSFTVATSVAAKAVPIVVFCGVPAVVTIEDGAVGVLVSEKLAGVATPATDAVTV
jgi:hypothetical protein